MNPKYVYSNAIYKVTKDVYVDANGNVVAHGANKSNFTPIPRYTVCSVYNKEDNTLAFGVARCSHKDAFKRSIGREISLKRALENPITTVTVPTGLRISRMTRDIAFQLIEQLESARN